MFFQLLAGGLWVGQYFQRLQYNVMSKDDRRNKWTSEGNASFGFSFWLALTKYRIVLINLFVLLFLKKLPYNRIRMILSD